jgi:outer membrane protein assembly factor BamE (lipoprotein component of BamABCDE complex)
MRRVLWTAALLALAAATAGMTAARAADPPSVDMDNVAKIQVGTSTASDVKALLGAPYRMTNYGDCNPIDYQEFWEYLGRDANGVFKIHIEFDDAHVARIIAKDNKKGPIVVLAAAPKPAPAAAHHH